MKCLLPHADLEEKLAGFLQFVLDFTERPHLLLHNTTCCLTSGAGDITL